MLLETRLPHSDRREFQLDPRPSIRGLADFVYARQNRALRQMQMVVPALGVSPSASVVPGTAATQEPVASRLRALRIEVAPREIETFGGRLQMVVNQRTSAVVQSLDVCHWLIMPSAIISDLPVPGERLRAVARSMGLTLVTPS